MTALNDLLDKATDITWLKALIYIGDCFEENSAEAVSLSQQLKLKGVRCFMFHDTSSGNQGYDVETARTIFQEIAQITGGALLPFDETSPDMIKALLEAIAIKASLGMKALEQRTKYLPAARLLIEQMKQ